MTYRDLSREIMFYGEFDRMPVLHWTGWPETIERWRGEGLPADEGYVREHACDSPEEHGGWGPVGWSTKWDVEDELVYRYLQTHLQDLSAFAEAVSRFVSA